MVVDGWIKRGVIMGHCQKLPTRPRVWHLEIPDSLIPKLESLAAKSKRLLMLRGSLPDRFEDGRWSIPGVSRLFSVSGSVVEYWLHKGLIVGEFKDFQDHGRVWWLTIPGSNMARLAQRALAWQHDVALKGDPVYRATRIRRRNTNRIVRRIIAPSSA
jgi:hypothetical protein